MAVITFVCVGVFVRKEKEKLFTQKQEPHLFTTCYVNVNDFMYILG